VVDDRAACVATKVDRTQSAEVHALRSACLTRRLAELSALVEVLGNADATTVEQAANAVGKLTPLDACTDNAALLVQPLPPSAPDVRAKVEAIRLDLVRVKALLDSAKYKEGMELVDARVADAEHAGYPPVRAEALFYRGALRDAVSDFPGAEEDLLRAADDAETSRHDELAARARTLLVWVIGYRQAKYEVGDALAHTARAAVKRAGARPDLAARLASDLGTLLWAEGKFRPARESYDEARVLWERAFGPEHPLVATAVNNVALALWSDGRLEEALEMHERALSLRTKLLGPAHPQVGTSQNNIGIVLLDLCRFAEARERHRRAIDIVSRAYGEKHPIVAGLQNNLGLAELELGESASAVRVLEHALATRKETLRADHPDIAGSLVNLAYADLVLENPDRARSRAEDALARLRTAFGPANPKLVDALVVHAKALRALRRPAEALVSARSAVDIATPALGARHAHYAASYVTLGGCLLDLRRAAEAVPAFTEVLSRADAFHDALVVGEAALGRARARRVIDPRADTREDLELARAKLTASGPRGAKLLRDLEGVPKD
jgi:serine/threonine-protein kinase